MSQTIEFLPLNLLSFLPISIGQPTVAASVVSDQPNFVIKLVRMTGGVIATLSSAQVENIEWTLNTPDSATFYYAKNSIGPDIAEVLGNEDGVVEVQIYHDGDLMFWGPIIQDDAAGSKGEIRCTAAGVDWYLLRRFIDGPITSYLQNGDFETGDLTNWSESTGVSTSIETDKKITGTYSVRLSGSDNESHIHQFFVNRANPVGLALVVSGWFYIEGFGSDGPAVDGRGLYIGATHPGEDLIDNWFVIEEATTRGKWQKATTQISIPPNQSWSCEVRCYTSAGGNVWWDDVKAVPYYSLSTPAPLGSEHDIAKVMSLIVGFLQRTDFDKSTLRLGTRCENTGITLAKSYQFVDHVQFDQAISEYIDRDDGIDYSVDLTPTTRVFHSYAGKRGTDRSGSITLKYTAGDHSQTNCADYRRTRSGGGTITSQTVIGDDNGPDREQGQATDASAIGGLILQDVHQASQGAEIGALEPIAAERLERYRHIPKIIEMDVLPSTNLAHTLKVGDVVHVLIDDGATQVDQDMRVQRMSLNGLNLLLTVTCAEDSL